MMTESDVQKLITEASRALDEEQYATAEELQRRVIHLLEAQAIDATRVENELEKLAGIHYQQGKFGLAAREYDRVQKSREALLPATDERNLRVLYWLGKTHFSDMKYDLAEAAFRRALAACETQPESPLMLLALFVSWASCCISSGGIVKQNSICCEHWNCMKSSTAKPIQLPFGCWRGLL